MLVGRECVERISRRWRRYIHQEIFDRKWPRELLHLVSVLILVLMINKSVERTLINQVVEREAERICRNFNENSLSSITSRQPHTSLCLLPRFPATQKRSPTTHNEVRTKIVRSTLSIKYFLWARALLDFGMRTTASDGKWTTNPPRTNHWFFRQCQKRDPFVDFRRLKVDLHLTQITHFSCIRQQVNGFVLVLPIAIPETKLSAWKAQLSPNKLANAESPKEKEKLELFTLKNRKQMCWREREWALFTSSAAAHDSARMPSTSWFQCRLSPHMRQSSYSHTVILRSVGAEKVFSCLAPKICLSVKQKAHFSVGNCWSSGQLPSKQSTADVNVARSGS